MLIHDSCSSAIESCVGTRTFAIARLYSEEKTMSIHIHDCYEVYFSISGGKQFLIDNRVYEFEAGDIFLSISLKVIISQKLIRQTMYAWCSASIRNT